MTITSYRCSRNVPLSPQISRIFLSSRRREDEGAVNLYYYRTCVVWDMYKIMLAAWQHRFCFTKSVGLLRRASQNDQCFTSAVLSSTAPLPKSDRVSAVHRPKPEFVLPCFVLPQSATQPKSPSRSSPFKLTPTDSKLGEPRATVNSIFQHPLPFSPLFCFIFSSPRIVRRRHVSLVHYLCRSCSHLSPYHYLHHIFQVRTL